MAVRRIAALPPEDETDPPVTMMIARRSKPGCEAAFEAVLRGMLGDAARFDGYQGSEVIRPAPGSDLRYRIAIKFASENDMSVWERSPLRRDWLERLVALSPDEPAVRVLTGLETWFTLPAGMPAETRLPSPMRMSVVTWLALFPLLTLLAWLLGPWMADWPLPARTFIMTALLVPLMTYVVMPRMTRLLASWLFRRAAPAASPPAPAERPHARGVRTAPRSRPRR